MLCFGLTGLEPGALPGLEAGRWTGWAPGLDWAAGFAAVGRGWAVAGRGLADPGLSWAEGRGCAAEGVGLVTGLAAGCGLAAGLGLLTWTGGAGVKSRRNR